jgi:hypothetical protein
MLATLIDTDALWHLAVYAFAGCLGFVGAFGLVVFARDRATPDRASAVARSVLMIAGIAGCLVVLAVGFWAMTQKPS